MARPTTILVVDDEPAIRRLLRTSLDGQGFSVVEAGSGAEALQQIGREKPDLLILDLGLPDVSGIEVIRSVRVGSSLPIIVLSVRDDERGKVEALDLGADDYVTKPFGTEELVARIRTALRHRFQAQGAAPLFVLGELAIDLVRRIVRRAGSEVHLSPKEYDLLAELAVNLGRTVSHKDLLRTVWGSERADIQYLRVYVGQLRQKLGSAGGAPLLVSEPGVGYRLVAIAA
jgi:two-component system, OmpR family, KDP operon response regulator KdpE